MLAYNTENKRILTDVENKNYVSISTENTENKRVKLILGDSGTPIEGLYLVDNGEGQYGIYSIFGGDVPDIIPEGTKIRGVSLEADGEYYIDESEVAGG